MLASNVLNAAMLQIEEMKKHVPAGTSFLIAGEYKAQNSGFAGALSFSILAIYLALMPQFRNIVKPLIVFAAIPFGCVGAFATLYLIGSPSASWPFSE
jgi:multidrug efflux pump subunit AcrB